MDIGSVIDALNKELGCNLDGSYYSYISQWNDWWSGYYKPFHEYRERYQNKVILRELYSMRMAKKICEDWASLLMNDKTHITSDSESSARFLQGENETGGMFRKLDFWVQENALIEKAFATGTGAAVLRFENMLVKDRVVIPDAKSRLRIDYLPAGGIIAISVVGDRVTEAAFVSEVTSRGKPYVYVETHMLGATGYVIRNRFYAEDQGCLTPANLPAGVVDEYQTDSDIPLFSLVSPNTVKNLSGGTGLGMAIFANAIDELKGVDLAFNNFCRDFKLGGKKVFYSKKLVSYDEKGNVITPDDIAMQLFMQTGDGDDLDADKSPLKEYNPLLRVSENQDGVQAMLDYLSFKVGFGTKHYQFNAGSIVTATQYSGDKQDLVQNASKHYIAVERHVEQIVRAILWAGKAVLGEDVDPDAAVIVDFDDSYIIDTAAQRRQDKEDALDGFVPKWMYNAKWRGMSEKDAKSAVMEAASETADYEPMGFGGDA